MNPVLIEEAILLLNGYLDRDAQHYARFVGSVPPERDPTLAPRQPVPAMAARTERSGSSDR